MGTIVPTRRGILGAMAIAPVVIAAPAVAAHGKVEAAFAEWKAVRQALNTSTDPQIDEADHPLWQRLKRAEETIRTSSETGPRVAEIRLWLCLTYELIYNDEVDAIENEDLDRLAAVTRDLEWSTMMAMQAIRALRGEGR